MARGTIFHFTVDPYTAGNMDESDFYENTERLDASYVENQDSVQSTRNLEDLKQCLSVCGFTVKEPEEGMENIAFTFCAETKEALDAAKMNYFRARFDALQKTAAQMDLKDFSCDTALSTKICSLADDEYDDAVWFDEGYGPSLNNLDRTIRCLEKGRIYHVTDNTVHMG